MTLSATAGVLRSPHDLLVEEADGELLIVSADNVFVLNETASMIFRLATSTQLSVGGIVQKISSHFDGDLNLMERDVIELLRELESSELIVILDSNRDPT